MGAKTHLGLSRGFQEPKPHMPIPNGDKIAAVLREGEGDDSTRHLVGSHHDVFLEARAQSNSHTTHPVLSLRSLPLFLDLAVV